MDHTAVLGKGHTRLTRDAEYVKLLQTAVGQFLACATRAIKACEQLSRETRVGFDNRSPEAKSPREQRLSAQRRRTKPASLLYGWSAQAALHSLVPNIGAAIVTASSFAGRGQIDVYLAPAGRARRRRRRRRRSWRLSSRRCSRRFGRRSTRGWGTAGIRMGEHNDSGRECGCRMVDAVRALEVLEGATG